MISPEAASTFATLVGLICNWKQERSGNSTVKATERYQDFMTWLVSHNFNKLTSQITDSNELQRDLTELLRQDSEVLAQKLDIITSSLASISDRIASFAEIARTLRAPTDTLSDQAIAILTHFDRSGQNRMIVFDFPVGLGFLPKGGKGIKVRDERFLEDDIAALQLVGFIQHVDSSSSGNPIYSLSRTGAKFASSLVESEPLSEM